MVLDNGSKREYVLYLFVDQYINNWLVTYVFDNPTTGNDIGDEGAKHLNLPANLQTLNLACKQ